MILAYWPIITGPLPIPSPPQAVLCDQCKVFAIKHKVSDGFQIYRCPNGHLAAARMPAK